MYPKKGEGLSLSMIIIAALGLIVLIIVAAIFRTHIRDYSEGYKKTANNAVESAGGSCGSFFSTEFKCSKEAPADTGWALAPEEGKCADQEEKCWKKVKEDKQETNSKNE